MSGPRESRFVNLEDEFSSLKPLSRLEVVLRAGKGGGVTTERRLLMLIGIFRTRCRTSVHEQNLPVL